MTPASSATLLLTLGLFAQGDVRVVSMLTRAGVCTTTSADEVTFSRMAGCATGTAAVAITRRDGRIVDVHVNVSTASNRASTDARTVQAIIAAVPSLEPKSAAHAIQAAALVQNGATARDLLGIASNTNLAAEPRRMAVTWYQIVAGASATEALKRIATSEGDDTSVREQALIALGNAGVDVALRIARTSGDEKMRRIASHRANLLAREEVRIRH